MEGALPIGGVTSILLTSILTTVGTFGVVLFKGWREERAKDKEAGRHARYLAVRVICSLDPFVSACCELANDDGGLARDGAREMYSGTTPKLSLPDDGDWKSIDPGLMYRILKLPNDTRLVSSSIDSVAEHEATPPNFDEYFDARTENYAKLGLQVRQLADDIRAAYQIAPLMYDDWDPKNDLTMVLQKLEEKRSWHVAAEAHARRRQEREQTTMR